MAMANNLFVGGFPYETTQEELNRLFATCGKVLSVKILIDRETGRSRGIGFVTMATDEEAKQAIAKLNGTALGARKIFVNEARPPEKRAPGAGGPGGPRPGFGGPPRGGPGGFSRGPGGPRGGPGGPPRGGPGGRPGFGDAPPWAGKAPGGGKKRWDKRGGKRKDSERDEGNGKQRGYEEKRGRGERFDDGSDLDSLGGGEF